MLRRQDKIAGYAYMAPALLLVTFLLVYPMLSNIYISFFKWDGLKPMRWLGVDNYVRFFGDINFTHSFTNTWIWVAFTLVAVVGMALMLAVFVKNVPGENFFKSIFFLPLAISYVSTGSIWIYMFGTEYGVINDILNLLGMQGRIGWLDGAPLNTISMLLASLWQGLGTSMVLYLKGLTSLPCEPLEAAAIDGAGAWRTFLHVTFPMLKPTHTIVIGMAMVNSFKTFDIIYIMTKGGPARSSETLAVTMYTETFLKSKLGYGAAIAVFLSAIILPIATVYIRKMIYDDAIDYK
jgi:multiple sugar transport system permease protein